MPIMFHLMIVNTCTLIPLYNAQKTHYNFLPTKYYAGFLSFKQTGMAEYDIHISFQALEINEFKNLNVSDFMIANSTGLNW